MTELFRMIKAIELAKATYASIKLEAVETKDDNSPVSNIDIALDDAVSGYLKTFAPAISEEGNKELPPLATHFYLIDPLDGTKGFLAGTREFALNVALIQRGPCGGLVPCAPSYEAEALKDPKNGALDSQQGSTQSLSLTTGQAISSLIYVYAIDIGVLAYDGGLFLYKGGALYLVNDLEKIAANISPKPYAADILLSLFKHTDALLEVDASLAPSLLASKIKLARRSYTLARLDASPILLCSSMHLSAADKRLLEGIDITSKSIGASLKYAIMPFFNALIIRQNGTSNWDTAAGSAILSVMGGEILALSSAKEGSLPRILAPLSYPSSDALGRVSGSYRNPYFVAYSNTSMLDSPSVKDLLARFGYENEI